MVSNRAPGIASCGRGAAGRMDHPVPVAVDDQRRHVDLPQLGGAVARREDRRQLAHDAGRGRVSVPRDSRLVAHRVLVERESMRTDVARTSPRPGPSASVRFRGGRDVSIRRQVDSAGRPSRVRAGGRHDRRQRADSAGWCAATVCAIIPPIETPTRCASAYAERIEQANGVPRHIAEVVLVAGISAAEHRHRVRRPDSSCAWSGRRPGCRTASLGSRARPAR